MKRTITNLLMTAALLGSTASAGTLWTGNVSVSAYNSLSAQTDSTPNITATGTRTRPGVIAVSRDILNVVGYHSKARIVRWTGGKGCNSRAAPQGVTYRVEDTMAKSQYRRVDIWLSSRQQALNFGRCNAVIQFFK